MAPEPREGLQVQPVGKQNDFLSDPHSLASKQSTKPGKGCQTSKRYHHALCDKKSML